MRIAAVGPHFRPDTAPTGAVMTRLIDECVDRGHKADIVTSLPWYRTHSIEKDWRGSWRRHEELPHGSIRRLHPFPADKSRLWARAAAFGGFSVLASTELAARVNRPDVVFAMSPPITLGLAGLVAARRWAVPLVFNIQDVFPDVAVHLGAITNPRVIAAFERVERFCYAQADAVTVLSEDLADNVRAKLPKGCGTEVVVIPNFADTGAITPDADDSAYRRAHNLGTATTVMYAGNIGHSQPLHLMIDTARAMQDRTDVVFVINGEGVARDRWEHEARDLPNVRFVDYQPAERLAETLAAGDIHVLVLDAGLARASVPSKLYSTLAAGRPVICAIDPGTEVDRVVTGADAGIVVAPDRGDDFRAAVEALVDDEARRNAMGQRARDFVETWPSPGDIAERYLALFERLQASS